MVTYNASISISQQIHSLLINVLPLNIYKYTKGKLLGDKKCFCRRKLFNPQIANKIFYHRGSKKFSSSRLTWYAKYKIF